jgi:hypothetical protein
VGHRHRAAGGNLALKKGYHAAPAAQDPSRFEVPRESW